MSIGPISPGSPQHPAQPQQSQHSVAESCRQFEASIWRSFIEQSVSAPKGAGGDVYQYFLSNTLADKMAGQRGGFAQVLAAQINGGAKSHQGNQPTPPTPGTP